MLKKMKNLMPGMPELPAGKNKEGRRLARWKFLLALALVFLTCSSAAAAREDKVLKDWTRSLEFTDSSGGQVVRIKVTYYAAEYIEALIRSEAEKNLWTRDEEERYRYNLLKTLDLEEKIAFHVDFDVLGTAVYLQPFDRQLKLYAGKRTLTPVDYDKRFNFKLQGQRDGMIWFPRFDGKTGKNLLDGVKDLRLTINGSISQATTRAGDVRFVWDIRGDDPSSLNKGLAASRLEMDRLIKRTEKLRTDRAKLQEQLDAIDKELREVDNRIDTLQTQND
ncbi:MAG: hypothetical protein LBR61_11195 [Synergistaceae bacterium]|jgi:hypothetical protein|nr:hypothetical protein [Synergistaceae bacterium]